MEKIEQSPLFLRHIFRMTLFLKSWAFISLSTIETEIRLTLTKRYLINQCGRVEIVSLVLQSIGFLKMVVCKPPTSSLEIFRSRKLILSDEK